MRWAGGAAAVGPVIGDGALPRAVEVALVRGRGHGRRLRRPNDQIASAVTGGFDVTMVVTRTTGG
ncbi:MAG: hypothetical protein LC720_04315 [Actinobacteria bacterium]|nr:hypothetical protein [Actinomycetota bacterium]